MLCRLWILCFSLVVSTQMMFAQDAETFAKLEAELGQKYAESERVRLLRGMRQVSSLWRKEDGDNAAFEAFVKANFEAEILIHDMQSSRLLIMKARKK
ncbi:hypothetical protein FBQ87_16260 [Sphingobacteriales bacterium CHB3]|nr:hypothetical protein [Sphingobacteriales bacterium CHB3]